MRAIYWWCPHWLPVLCNIASPKIRHRGALFREFSQVTYQLHISQSNKLRSRKPPLPMDSQLVEVTVFIGPGFSLWLIGSYFLKVREIDPKLLPNTVCVLIIMLAFNAI